MTFNTVMYHNAVIPSEVQFPIEASPGHVARRDVLEGVVADYIYDRTDNGMPVVRDS